MCGSGRHKFVDRADPLTATADLMLVLVLSFSLCDDGRIGQRRRIAERLPLGDVAQQPPHDLARARLRQVGREDDVVGPRDGADLLARRALSARRSALRRRWRAFLQRDERRDRLALDLVRPADDRGFGDVRVIDQRALDFHRADAVAGDVQHVVHAAEQPEEAVLVALRAVAGEVDVRRPLAPGTCLT